MEILWLAVTVLALAGLALLAYSLRALDGPGSVASFLIGLVLATAAGFGWLLLLTCFTVLGVLATRVGYATKKARRVAEGDEGQRGVANVLGNGLAAVLVAVLIPLGVDGTAVRLAFATAVAAVTADTMASELGVLSRHARLATPPFPRVAGGVNGAVSFGGQFAALLGSFTIALAATWLIDLPPELAWIPFLAGWLGCQLDSVLGATLERDATKGGPLSKQQVNFLCGAFPAAVVLVCGLAFL